MIETNRTTIAVSVLLILVPIYVGRIQELIPNLDKLYLARVTMIIGLSVFGLTSASYRNDNRHLFSIPQIKYSALFFVLAIISAPFGMWPMTSYEFIFNSYLKLILFIYLLISCISTEEDLQKILWSLVASAMALMLAVFISPADKAGRVYASGTYDPNDLALLLAVVFPVMFYLMEQSDGWKKILLLGGILMTLLVMIKTGSRGGFLALMTSVAVILLQKEVMYTIKRIPVILMVIVAVLAYAPQEQVERLNSMFETDYNQTAKGGRIEIWKRGLSLMVQNPLLGIGVAQFEAAEGKIMAGAWRTAHNSFIQIGAELGVTGLILYLLLIKHSFESLSEAAMNLEKKWIISGLRASLCGLCVGMMFLSWAYAYGAYFMFGVCIIIRKISMNRGHADV